MNTTRLEEGIYTVVTRDENSVTVIFSDASHPVFKAHFEGNPILPGFMQIDIIAAIKKKRVSAITQAKFMKPLLPGDRITYHIDEGAKATRISLKDAKNTTVSSFKVEWEPLGEG